MASFPGQQAKAEHIMPLQSETPHQCGNGLSDCLLWRKAAKRMRQPILAL